MSDRASRCGAAPRLRRRALARFRWYRSEPCLPRQRCGEGGPAAYDLAQEVCPPGGTKTNQASGSVRRIRFHNVMGFTAGPFSKEAVIRFASQTLTLLPGHRLSCRSRDYLSAHSVALPFAAAGRFSGVAQTMQAAFPRCSIRTCSRPSFLSLCRSDVRLGAHKGAALCS